MRNLEIGTDKIDLRGYANLNPAGLAFDTGIIPGSTVIDFGAVGGGGAATDVLRVANLTILSSTDFLFA